MRSTPSAFTREVLGKHPKAISSRPHRKGNRPIVRCGADKHGVGSNAGPISFGAWRSCVVQARRVRIGGERQGEPGMPTGPIKNGALCAAALFLSASPVLACSILPPPRPPAQESGESAEAYAERIRAWSEAQEQGRQAAETRERSFREGFEAALWSASERIVLAEIVEIGYLENGPAFLRGTPEVTLRVIRVQRGAAQPGPFTMTYTGMTSCGPIGPVNVVRGNPGQRFVIFARPGALSTETTIGSYALADAQDGRTIGLLEGRLPPRD